MLALNYDIIIVGAGHAGSDAAAACGIHPYLSMLELWMIKTGRLHSHLDDDIDGYSPLYWGNTLEPMVAKYYQQHTGNTSPGDTDQDSPADVVDIRHILTDKQHAHRTPLRAVYRPVSRKIVHSKN